MLKNSLRKCFLLIDSDMYSQKLNLCASFDLINNHHHHLVLIAL